MDLVEIIGSDFILCYITSIRGLSHRYQEAVVDVDVI